MKAIVAKKAGGPEVLEFIDIDEPTVLSGEVKIKVRAFGLNKAESYYRSGNYGTLNPNFALGIEAVGEVISDSSGELNVGQKVATAMGGMMFARHGSYAEVITVKKSNVIKINSSLNFQELAALPESYLTIWGALEKSLKISFGQTLLVRGGTSSAGLSAISYAKAKGLRVVATTRNINSVEKLKKSGADFVLIDKGEISEELKKIFPDGVDNALEVVGTSTVKDTLKCVTNWGGVVVIGLLSGPPVLDKFNLMGDLPNTVNLSFFGSGILGTDKLPLDKAPLDWIALQIEKGMIPSHLSKTFNIEEIHKAHQLLDSNTANGKIVVTF